MDPYSGFELMIILVIVFVCIAIVFLLFSCIDIIRLNIETWIKDLRKKRGK